jgi:manganese/zinc/iron transport system ATP- binding protein
MSDSPALEVHKLRVSYGQKPALWDISLAIPNGTLTAIIGPNGAGKSTLLKSVLGLIPASSGHSRIFGSAVPKSRNRTAYVPQTESVDWDFPISVVDVVLMGRYGKLGWLKRPAAKDREIAQRCLEMVGLPDLAKRQIGQLSGGQQQRVFLARALASEADLFLMDEPFAGIDAASEAAIIEIMRELRSAGKTVVSVHHDLQTASEYFDWIVLLNCRLIAAGPTNKVLTPQNLHDTYGGRLRILERVSEAITSAQTQEG